jgi:hypothetical protein
MSVLLSKVTFIRCSNHFKFNKIILKFGGVVVNVDGVRMSVLTAAISRPIVQSLQVVYEHDDPRWNYIDRVTEVLGDKPVPVPLCPPQIPHGVTRARTLTFSVRAQ